jgi:hypothetical protein
MAGADSDWKPVATVVSRALAFLCLQSHPAKEGSMLDKANFLCGLGLTYEDAAEMLGSSEASLKELARLAKKPKKHLKRKKGKQHGK